MEVVVFTMKGCPHCDELKKILKSAENTLSGGGSSKVKKLNYKPDNLYIENTCHITEKKFNKEELFFVKDDRKLLNRRDRKKFKEFMNTAKLEDIDDYLEAMDEE